MDSLKLFSVSDVYIAFLREDLRLARVFDNKEGKRVHTRKYIGVVLEINGYSYFAPMSSPKPTDYIADQQGNQTIRKSLVPIIRVVTMDTYTGKAELKGTIRLSSMIPVPASELTYYDINQETDIQYKDLVTKQYAFITANRESIIDNAKLIYHQKSIEPELIAKQRAPGYLSGTLDFKYAEAKCAEFELNKTLQEVAATREK